MKKILLGIAASSLVVSPEMKILLDEKEGDMKSHIECFDVGDKNTLDINWYQEKNNE
ncbi:MAG: hypothetical protein ACRC1F_00800 [Metamycoplasmataceae bacterium]